ncbi:MAG: hypothetical protein KME45_03345 [Stenomitos rutilans HA7619-LM2]|nr:hypothetical protein [Stenomitos rutilans HA7619-LM2]MBW4469420.1 hypothetical protein [Stenomitos rutilans HA7619-LM2]
MSLGELTEAQALVANRSADPRARIGSGMGSYGLAPALAAQLRSAVRQVWLQA